MLIYSPIVSSTGLGVHRGQARRTFAARGCRPVRLRIRPVAAVAGQIARNGYSPGVPSSVGVLSGE